MAKKPATVARDKRGRKNAAETRAAGLRSTVSVRLTNEERAELESYARMRGMTLSEAIRSRACHYSPSEEKVAAYTERLYYGMRETGVELIESNSAVRIAYEENARKAFALSTAVNRVGVNLNQIARCVNAGAVGDDAERWLEELQYCSELLNEILEKGGVSEIRAIPPLMGGGASTSTEASDASQNASENRVEKAPEKKVVEVSEKASAEPVENDAKKDAEIESDARAEKKAETKSKTDAKSTAKPKPKPTGKPASETAPKKKSEKPREKSAEKMQEASTEPEREKPGAEAVGGTREGSRKYDVERDMDWVLGLLDKNGAGDHKRHFQEARETMREGNGE